MNIKKNLLFILTIVLFASTLIVSCRNRRITDAELEAAEDQSFAEGTSQEVQSIADQANKLGSSSGYRLASNSSFLGGGCATFTFDSINPLDVDTMVVDFGTTPCQGKDNRFRKGKIIVNYTDRYRNAGAIIDITFDNYFVGKSTSDMRQITGNKHIVNNGLNTAGNMNWTITAALSIIKSAGTATFTENKTREWIAGASTPLVFSDDKYKVAGSANGTAANGTAYTAVVITNHELIRDFQCPKHFVEGQIEITPSGKPKMLIDFGNGNCDNTATITRKGKTKTITLH